MGRWGPDGPSSSNDCRQRGPPKPPPRPLPTEDQEVPFHRATPSAATPPAMVKFPAAYSAGRWGPAGPSSSKTASANTEPSVPPPTGDQADPLHLAMLLTTWPLTVSKSPPTYSSGAWGPAGPSSSNSIMQ